MKNSSRIHGFVENFRLCDLKGAGREGWSGNTPLDSTSRQTPNIYNDITPEECIKQELALD
ncbi:hypothetical protein NUACC21_34600 [Scytonema sp. NUACC21]